VVVRQVVVVGGEKPELGSADSEVSLDLDNTLELVTRVVLDAIRLGRVKVIAVVIADKK
jgi:hypothetical protein